MQVLKTTVKLRPGINPFGKGWWSGWVISMDNVVIKTSKSMSCWNNRDVGFAIHWARRLGGDSCFESEFIDE